EATGAACTVEAAAAGRRPCQATGTAGAGTTEAAAAGGRAFHSAARRATSRRQPTGHLSAGRPATSRRQPTGHLSASCPASVTDAGLVPSAHTVLLGLSRLAAV